MPKKSGIPDFRGQIPEKNLGHVLRIPIENNVPFYRKGENEQSLFYSFLWYEENFIQNFLKSGSPRKRLNFFPNFFHLWVKMWFMYCFSKLKKKRWSLVNVSIKLLIHSPHSNFLNFFMRKMSELSSKILLPKDLQN